MRDPRKHRGRTEQRPEYIGRRMGTIEEAERSVARKSARRLREGKERAINYGRVNPKRFRGGGFGRE